MTIIACDFDFFVDIRIPIVAGKGAQINIPKNMNYNCTPSDKRIKSYFEIVNDSVSPPIILPVGALSDGGSMGQLTLPARKISQLGLVPHGGKAGRIQTKGTVPGATTGKLLFVPHVIVKFYFVRQQTNEVNTRECITFATCYETEYNDYLTAAATKADAAAATTQSGAETVLPVSPLPDAEPPAAAEPSAPPAPAHIAAVNLSPVTAAFPCQQVALGQEVLSKLAVHADFAKTVLWVEEEEATELND